MQAAIQLFHEIQPDAADPGQAVRFGTPGHRGTAQPVWQAIADIDLTVVNAALDEHFAFIPTDHDGKNRMDFPSTVAMANLLTIKDRFDLVFGNDPDADRHDIVEVFELMTSNHFLAVGIHYMLGHRPEWSNMFKVCKTPGESYREFVLRHEEPHYRRVDTLCSLEQKATFTHLSPEPLSIDSLAGDLVSDVLMAALGNQAAIGGLKVIIENGWFAARPIGIEALYKVYAESFKGEEHLEAQIQAAQPLMDRVLVAE